MTANDGEERKMLNLSREKYDEGPRYDVVCQNVCQNFSRDLEDVCNLEWHWAT